MAATRGLRSLQSCALSSSYHTGWALVDCLFSSGRVPYNLSTSTFHKSHYTTGTDTQAQPISPLGTYRTLSNAVQREYGHQDQLLPNGLRHSRDTALDARLYKSAVFAQGVVKLLVTLGVPTWTTLSPSPSAISIRKVSGSLTNAIFFISHTGAKTVLLRVYGPSSGELISRPHELHTLHVLSSQYGIGPRVYGTFVNGRVEEYFASSPLTCYSVRDPRISAWVAMRMAELHGVDLNRVELEPERDHNTVRRNVRRWLGPAREVLRRAHERGHAGIVGLNLDGFQMLWERYWEWLMGWERVHGASPRVFAHNDTQYGNLLQLNDLRAGTPAHHRIIVVDFEYAGPNAAAFDIANHFNEWTADYDGSQPYELRRERYPGLSARRNFYVAYLTQARSGPAGRGTYVPTDGELDELDNAVMAWTAASHGMWGVWAIAQAAEDVEAGVVGEFDYLRYGRCRLEHFEAAIKDL